MKTLFLLLITLFYFSVNAQNYTIENQKTIGGYMSDHCTKIIELSNGDLIILSTSQSPVSGEKTLPCFGSSDDYWVICLDSLFNIKWQKVFGGGGSDLAMDIIANDNQILIVGHSTSGISGNKTVTNHGGNNTDVWIISIDFNGNENWQKVFGGNGNEKVSSIINDGANFLVLAISDSDSSGTKTENSRGSYDYWIFEIDSLGNQLWDKTIGGNKGDYISNARFLASDTLIIVGSSISDISGDKSESRISASSIDPDAWVLKFVLSSKSIVWDKTIGGLDEDGGLYSYSGTVCLMILNRDIFLITNSNSGIGGTKTSQNFGSQDIWINKLNSNGLIIWDKSYGGNDFDRPSDVIKIFGDKFLIAGQSSSGISGNKTSGTNGSADLWFLTLDTAGNIIADFNIGGSDGDIAANIIKLHNEGFLASSTSLSSISGDKTENNRGFGDNWILKFSFPAGIDELPKFIPITLYPNPTTVSLTISLAAPGQRIASLRVYDELGRLVLSDEPKSQKAELMVKALSSGVYIVEGITNNGNKFVEKFVKE